MFADYSHSFYYSVLLIGALTGLLLYSRVSAPFKSIAILLVVTLAGELIARYFKYQLKITNNPVYHLFTVIEYLLYAIIYGQFFASKKWNKILIVSVLILVIGELINVAFYQLITQSNTNTLLLESLLLIVLSLNLFLTIRSDMAYGNLMKEGVFWFNAGVLLYYAVAILIWGFHSLKVYELQNPPRIIYTLLLLFNSILYSLFVLAICLNAYHKSTPKSVV
jgi:hypothetical protein